MPPVMLPSMDPYANGYAWLATSAAGKSYGAMALNPVLLAH